MKDSSAIVFFHKFEMFKLMINKLKLGFKPVDAATFAGFFQSYELATDNQAPLQELFLRMARFIFAR